MLVLSRKETESLMIGDNIEVTVMRIQGNRVSLGIKAGNEVRILRAELQSHTQGGECLPTTFLSMVPKSISQPIAPSTQLPSLPSP